MNINPGDGPNRIEGDESDGTFEAMQAQVDPSEEDDEDEGAVAE